MDEDYRLREGAFVNGLPNLTKDDLKRGWSPLAVDAHHWSLDYIRCPKSLRANVLLSNDLARESVEFLKENNLWVKVLKNEQQNLSKDLNDLFN